MKSIFLPKSRIGKWAVCLFAAFIILAMVGGLIAAAIVNPIEYPNPINSPLLGSVIYLMFASAIAASVMGIIAVKKAKERAVLVYLSIPLGILFFIAIIGFVIAIIFGPTD